VRRSAPTDGTHVEARGNRPPSPSQVCERARTVDGDELPDEGGLLLDRVLSTRSSPADDEFIGVLKPDSSPLCRRLEPKRDGDVLAIADKR
jgi:hypothetical protein